MSPGVAGSGEEPRGCPLEAKCPPRPPLGRAGRRSAVAPSRVSARSSSNMRPASLARRSQPPAPAVTPPSRSTSISSRSSSTRSRSWSPGREERRLRGAGRIGRRACREPEIVVIDPVDGSKNAACGIPQFSLSVAVASGSTMADVWFGYVYDFGTGEEHVAAVDGPPPERDQRPAGHPRLLGCESAEPALLVPGLAAIPLDELDEVRVVGSIAITLSYLARHRLSAVLTCKGCRSVDAAAGQLIARQADMRCCSTGVLRGRFPWTSSMNTAWSRDRPA